MSLPITLQKQIDEALYAIQEHPKSDLDPFHRLVIYQFFASLSGLKGRIARIHLSVMAAHRVLHLYDVLPEEHGYPTMPRLMISTAEQLLSHLSEGLTEQQLNELATGIMIEVGYGPEAQPIEVHTHTAMGLARLAQEMNDLTGEMPTSLYYHAWCAFLAAKSALDEALGWDVFRNAVIDASTSNSDLKWIGDTAKWAAIAYAGGEWTEFEEQDPSDFSPQGNWNYSSTIVRSKRKEFWEWWCSEVIPTAWRYSA
ncbi:MAG: hypothetical protein H6652_07595 [Ardenticatenaceae bacterium]|nr:hypothetical protein [Ardenticatenaceae bacterium]